MRPNLGDAKVDKILTQFSQFYTNDQYISEMILPVLKVKEKTGKFAKYGKENLRPYTGQLVRAPGVRAVSADFSVSQGSYNCTEKALEKGVPDEFIANTDDPYNPKRDAVAVIMDNIMVNQEVLLATALGDTATMTLNTTLTGTSQWNDEANSDPIGDIETAINAVRAATGKRPNTAVMGHDVFMTLKFHPDIREQLKFTNGGQLSDTQLGGFLKEFFNLKNVYVGTAVKNGADQGQSDSISDIWTKNFVVLYQTDRPSLMNATFGYTFADVPKYVDQYREESHKRDVVRVQYSFDQAIMDANLGYLIKNAIA